jgi:succinate dehydrogenase/fumarate reductase iron-sulfur protein
MNLTISIQRYDPEADAEPRWVDYSVPSGDRTTVLETLAHIYENSDPTLAFRFGCRFSACGLCAVQVNDRPAMACTTQLKDGMKIAPLPGMPVLRDLVIDRSRFFEALRELQIYIPEQEDSGEPQLLRPSKTHARLAGCVECLGCNATCPAYDFEKNPLAGPYVLVKLMQLQLDPRNTMDRRKQARDLGIDACGECRDCYCLHGINIRRDVLEVLAGEDS